MSSYNIKCALSNDFSKIRIKQSKIIWKSRPSSNKNISALTALCEESSPVTAEFHSRRPASQSFDVWQNLPPKCKKMALTKCTTECISYTLLWYIRGDGGSCIWISVGNTVSSDHRTPMSNITHRKDSWPPLNIHKLPLSSLYLNICGICLYKIICGPGTSFWWWYSQPLIRCQAIT